MNAKDQENRSSNDDSRSEGLDRQSKRRQRIEDRRAGRAGSPWIVGGILILAGILILLQNLTSFELKNWWALFILIPAFGAFGNAWRAYTHDGKLSAPARAALISGIILTMITATFLLGLNWTILGPTLLILAGVGLLLNVLIPAK
jgi:hypothetical protein